jgi:hypothetical protein
VRLPPNVILLGKARRLVAVRESHLRQKQV